LTEAQMGDAVQHFLKLRTEPVNEDWTKVRAKQSIAWEQALPKGLVGFSFNNSDSFPSRNLHKVSVPLTKNSTDGKVPFTCTKKVQPSFRFLTCPWQAHPQGVTMINI